MKTQLSFVVLIVLLAFSCNSASAQTTDISLSTRNSKNSVIYIDVFMSPDTRLCGGEFTLYIDYDALSYDDVSSDFFEIDAHERDSKIKIVIAESYDINITNNAIFTVKLYRKTDSQTEIKLEVNELFDEELVMLIPENNVINATVDLKSGSVKSVMKEDKRKEKKSATESTTSEESTKSESTADFVPVKVESDNKRVVVGILVVALVVVAFIFGSISSRIFAKNKRDKKQ